MRLLLLMTALVAGLALLAIAGPLHHLHGQPGPDYRLLFTPPRESRADLATAWPDGRHPTLLDLASPTQSVHVFTWSPDGQWIAYLLQAAGLNELHRSPPDRAAPQRLIQTTMYTTQTSKWLIPAPNQQAAVAIERLGPRSTLIHLSADLGSARRLIAPLEATMRDVFWSPDSRWVYYRIYDAVRQEFATYRVPAAGGPPQKISGMDIHAPVWSPDGRWLAYTNGAGTVTPTLEIRRADGQLVLQGEAQPQTTLRAWTNDDWLIGHTQDNRRLWRIAPGSGEQTPVAPAEIDQYFAGLAPDGRHVFYATSEVAVNGWRLHRLNPATMQSEVLGQGHGIAGPYNLPDGSGAVFAVLIDETVEIYRLNAAGTHPQPVTHLPEKAGGYRAIGLRPTPDSQALYVLTDWNVGQPQPLRIRLRDGQTERLPPGFLPDPSPWVLADWAGDRLLLAGGGLLAGGLLILTAGLRWRPGTFLRKTFIDIHSPLSDN